MQSQHDILLHHVAAQILHTKRDNDNNNIYDNVYGAITMTKVIATVHPVHLMNVD